MISTALTRAGEGAGFFAGSKWVFDLNKHKTQGILLLLLVPAPEITGLLMQEEVLAPLGSCSPHLRRCNSMGRAQHGHARHGVWQEHPLDVSARPSMCSDPTKPGGRCRRDFMAPAALSALKNGPIAVVFQCPLVPKHRGFMAGLSLERR